MATIKEIGESLETVSAIAAITSVYQDLAYWRMNQIQKEVLKTRKFVEGIAEIYKKVKSSYFASLKKKGGGLEKISFIAQKREEVVVFLSANEFFYGTLILDVWRKVLNYLNENKADLVVIGKIGQHLSRREGLKTKNFNLDNDWPEIEKIKEIVEFVKNYQKVTVFHGKFETVLNQKPALTDISGGIPLEEKTKEVKMYLFEPSPEAILQFFETEILSALFNQTLLEHRLARYAARMMAMYEATESAKEMKENLEKTKIKLRRQLENKRQIELFSSFKLWS